MRVRDLPPLDILNDLLSYNPETGELRWKTHRLRRNVGQPAGFLNGKGYLEIYIKGVRYLAHRVVWKLHHKVEPPPETVIDHINCNRSDNRAENLRIASYSENNVNTVGRSYFGLPAGVTLNGRNVWRVRVRWKGKTYNLGNYNSIEDAVTARANKLAELQQQ
jgi:hypothetical protein